MKNMVKFLGIAALVAVIGFSMTACGGGGGGDGGGSSSIEMVFVAGGSFDMGKNGEETPSINYRVTLSGFYIGKYEVTQSQWQTVMGRT